MSYGEHDESTGEMNTGPSFDFVEDIEELQSLDDEEEWKKEWMEQYSNVPSPEIEKIPHETEYGYVREDRPPHHWIEQDDGSWVCRTCGQQKVLNTKEQKKKDDKNFDLDDVVRRVEEARKQGILPSDTKDDSFLQDVRKGTIGGDYSFLQGVVSDDISTAKIIHNAVMEKDSEGTQIVRDYDDERLWNEGKMKKTPIGEGDEKGFVTQEHSQQLACDWKYSGSGERPCQEVAFYSNGDGKHYCSEHIFDIDNVFNVEKIVYSNWAQITKDLDGQNSIGKTFFSDTDKFILDLQGKSDSLFFPVKKVKGFAYCEEKDQNGESCAKLAMYYLIYRDGTKHKLCEDHVVSLASDWNKVKYVAKLVCPRVPLTAGRLEGEGKEEGEVVIPEMLNEHDGNLIINTQKELKEAGYGNINNTNNLGESYFLYLCSDSVAKKRARFKIYNPATGYVNYFNVPIRDNESVKGVFFDRDFVDIPMAKKIYADFIGKDRDNEEVEAGRLSEVDLILSCRLREKAVADEIGYNEEYEKFDESVKNEADVTKKMILIKNNYSKWRKFASKDWRWDPVRQKGEKVENKIDEDVVEDSHHRRKGKIKVMKKKAKLLHVKKHIIRKNIIG